MNKKGQIDFRAIIWGIFALFFAFIFFGIIFPMLNEISGNVLPAFLIGFSFLVIVISIIATIIRAFGGRI